MATKTTSTPATKPVKKTTPTVQASGLSVAMFDKTGKSTSTLALPKELFGGKVNEALLNQYVHVYLTNQRQGNVSAKTRSEVRGSTRKIYRQKGTGRARHGAKTAPIFVGGGVTFGPKPRIFKKTMNKKQRQQVLLSARSHSLKNKKIFGFSDTILKIEPKTKNVVGLLKNADVKEDRVLVVMPKDSGVQFLQASRNIRSLTVTDARSLNAYELLKAKKILLFESSVKTMVDHFISKQS